MKIIYLLAWGRSGSTVLGNLLGELDGFFHGGEIRTIWGLGLRHGRLCGCGVPVRDCPVWSEIMEMTFRQPDLSGIDPNDVYKWQLEVMRMRHMGKLMNLSPGGPTGWRALDSYRRVQASLYQAIRQVTGASTIVDSSKRPPDAALLPLLPELDSYVIHLVRDPRAVAHSWRGRKRSPGEGRAEEMLRYSLVTSSRNWLAVNLSGEALRRRWSNGRVTLLRYEDFAADPRSAVSRILTQVDEERKALPFVDDRTALFGTNHTAGGNPDRLTKGRIRIRANADWLAHQPVMDRLVATLVTLPLLHRYGYPVWPTEATFGRRLEDG